MVMVMYDENRKFTKLTEMCKEYENVQMKKIKKKHEIK